MAYNKIYKIKKPTGEVETKNSDTGETLKTDTPKIISKGTPTGVTQILSRPTGTPTSQNVDITNLPKAEQERFIRMLDQIAKIVNKNIEPKNINYPEHWTQDMINFHEDFSKKYGLPAPEFVLSTI